MNDSVEQDRRPVIVLGAGGFIGSRVVRALSTSRIWRPAPVYRTYQGPGTFALDVTEYNPLRALISVVNDDGRPPIVNCMAGNPRSMVRATEALCNASRWLPPGRIVHLSSMAVYGAATGDVTEDQVPVAPVSGYGRAKLECETILRRYSEGGGDVVVLRPSCVFGPGSSQWATRIASLLRAGRLGDLGPAGDGGCNLAYVDDLVATIMNALDAPEASGNTYNVSSPEIPTWNEFLVRFGLALQATPIRRIPARNLKIEAKLLAPAHRILGRRIKRLGGEAITPSLVSLFAQDIRLSSSAASSQLSMPATPVEKMIQTTARWVDHQTARQPEKTLA